MTIDDTHYVPHYNHCMSGSASPENRSADDLAVEKVESILYGVLMPILSALGIVGNILNLVVLTRPNLMKIITYTYFRAMAISDLLTMITVIFFVLELTGHKFTSYFGTLFQAHFVLPCLNALVGSSVLAIVAVTFERWLSICHPIQAKNIQSPLRAKLIIAAAWVIPFALYLPYCFRKYVTMCWDPEANRTIYVIEDNPAFKHDTPGYSTYGWIRESILRLIPMVVLAALNIRIVFALRQVQNRRRRLKGGHSMAERGDSKAAERKRSASDGLSRNSSLRQSAKYTPAQKAEFRRLQEERRLVLLLIGIVVMFLVCITPAAILLILPVADEEFGLRLKLFRAVANVLELTNYALNFYVYVGCSSDFRLTFVNVFCRRCTRGKKGKENGEIASYGTRMGGEHSHIGVTTRTSIPATASQAVSTTRNNTPVLNHNSTSKRNSRLTIPGQGDLQQLTESQSLLNDAHDV